AHRRQREPEHRERHEALEEREPASVTPPGHGHILRATRVRNRTFSSLAEGVPDPVSPEKNTVTVTRRRFGADCVPTSMPLHAPTEQPAIRPSRRNRQPPDRSPAAQFVAPGNTTVP